MKLGVLSVVPSPYQRDLFAALADLQELDLSVAYLEDAAPDSPWPKSPLASYETILPGFTIGKGRVRCHVNRQLPDPTLFDAYIVNTSVTALTTQQLFRRLNQHPNWFFWGETLRSNAGIKALIQSKLAKPIGRAKAIVAIGSTARKAYQARFPDSRVEELPYYCDLSKFSTARRSNPVPTFLFCGQMIQRKGVDLLIEAFSKIRASGVEAKLILAGRQTNLVDDLPPDIELVGFTAPSDLPKLFARADVFVLPSRHDGWGVVINQAIGAGLPIISTDAVGAAIDLVENNINGIVVEAGKLEPLIEAMQTLATDTSKLGKMAQQSAVKAADLSPAAGARRWHKILTCASS